MADKYTIYIDGFPFHGQTFGHSLTAHSRTFHNFNDELGQYSENHPEINGATVLFDTSIPIGVIIWTDKSGERELIDLR